MSDTGIVTYDQRPPDPMTIFTERVIHPDNEAWVKAAEERLKRFKPLPWMERLKLDRRARQLRRKLQRAGVFDVVRQLNELNDERRVLLGTYRDAKAEVKQLRALEKEPSEELMQRGREARDRGRQVQAKLRGLEQAIAPHEKDFEEYIRVRDRLQEHVNVLNRLREEEENRKQFYKEGKIFQRALKEAFLINEGCHIVRYTRKGKPKKVTPRFQEVYLNSYVHSVVLLTSKRTFFGGFKPKLQVNVERLIDEKKTLRDASAILHRQVYVDFDETGSLPIFKMNRLDARDGLPQRVLFEGMIDLYPVVDHEKVPLPVGIGIKFVAQWLTLEATPHLLIAGSTGTGKSNYANCLMATLLYTQTPEEVRVMAIDNKDGVEFWRYRGVPHLVSVSDSGDKVLPALLNAIAIMQRRLGRLKASGAKNLLSLNAMLRREKQQIIPRLIVFIDELNVLVGREDTSDIHNSLIKLTALGRAAGVHVIAATQYPTADVIPVAVKNNMDSIVCFHVSNVNASNMLFNDAVAYAMKNQIGQAHVAEGGNRYFVQTPFLSEGGLERAIRYSISNHVRPPFQELDRELALELDDTSPVSALPAPALEPEWTEEDLLSVAFSQFGGALKARAIFESIKSQGLATQRQVEQMCQIVRARGNAEHDGQRYKVERGRGNVFQLVPITDSSTPQEEPAGSVSAS